MTNQNQPTKRLRRRALLSSVAMLLVAAFALTTATYAWFTSSTSAKVDTLNVNVAAASGIQLSATGTGNWRSTLPVDQLTAVETNVFPTDNGYFSPCSSDLSLGGAAGNYTLNLFDGVLANDLLTSTAVTTTNKTYVKFDVYAKVSQDTPLYLFDQTAAVDKTSAKLTSALRVALIDNGAVSNEGQVTSWSTNLISGSSPATNASYVWEPKSDDHITSPSDYKGTQVAESGNSKAKNTYYGFKAAFNGISLDAANTAGDNVALVETTQTPKSFPTIEALTSNESTYSNCKVADLKAGINKVTIYVWVEGQDMDCLNEISGSDLGLNLVFGIKKAQG